jgi:hypothetical protein
MHQPGMALLTELICYRLGPVLISYIFTLAHLT